MFNITIDIETIPTQSLEKIAVLKSSVSPPKTIKKAASIDAWFEKNKEMEEEKIVNKTALNGGYGQISHIGFKLNDQQPECLYVNDITLKDEYELLKNFNEKMGGLVDMKFKSPYFIGHNIVNFDLKFLFHRFVIHGIKPKFRIPWDERKWNHSYFDTMIEWAGNRDYISLDELCNILGIESPKGDISGKNVWEAIKEKKFADVAQYCKNDVTAVYKVYNKLTFNQL